MLVGWLLIRAVSSDGATIDMPLIVFATVMTFCFVRLAAGLDSRLAPAVIVLAAGTFAWLRADILFAGPLTAPLGYSNAAGSLFMLASAAAVLWLLWADYPLPRLGAAIMAASFAVVPVMNGTRTAAALLCFLPLALLAASRRRARAAVLVSAAALALVATSVLVLVIAYVPDQPRLGPLDRAVDATLSERRVELWADAVALTFDNPMFGVGPGRFATISSAARKDPDTAQPHNEFLHISAEAGLPALLLCLALVGWVYGRLWHAPDQRGAAIGAFALGAAGVHANVDYVLHFPAIPMAAAAIVAASMGVRSAAPGHARGHPRSNPSPAPADVAERFGSRAASAGSDRAPPAADFDETGRRTLWP